MVWHSEANVVSRAMILQGYTAVTAEDVPAAVKIYERALDILQGGVKRWPNDPDRGAIFTETFVRGVRRLHLTAYTQVKPCQGRNVDSRDFSFVDRS